MTGKFAVQNWESRVHAAKLAALANVPADMRKGGK
jgi:hypothetical protein